MIISNNKENFKAVNFLIFIILYFKNHVKFKISRKKKYISNHFTKLSFNYIIFYIKVSCDSCTITSIDNIF